MPTYGSSEWQQLPDGSVEKVAACVIAAECWRTTTDPAWIAWKLRAELEATAPEFELTQEQRNSYSRARPSFAELSKRRGDREREARANEHRRRLGLPVEPDTDHGDPEHAPARHVDGRPVKYKHAQRWLQAVRDE